MNALNGVFEQKPVARGAKISRQVGHHHEQFRKTDSQGGRV